jgi:regulator of RNase E activity RraA
MVGFAVTSAFRGAAPPEGADVYNSVDRQLEHFAALSGPAIIVFQDLDDPPAAATFGDVMCSTYQAFGAAGLISSGAGRDLEPIRQMRFPVFSSGALCAHGYCHLLHIGSPVRVGGLVVRQGDLLHGDGNGVTNIPLEIARELPEVAREFLVAERRLVAFLQSSQKKSIAQCADARKEFKADIERISQRITVRTG